MRVLPQVQEPSARRRGRLLRCSSTSSLHEREMGQSGRGVLWRGGMRLHADAGADERLDGLNLNPFVATRRDDGLAAKESLLRSLNPLELRAANRNQPHLRELGSNLLLTHAERLRDAQVAPFVPKPKFTHVKFAQLDTL
jgi:hypothetical protein